VKIAVPASVRTLCCAMNRCYIPVKCVQRVGLVRTGCLTDVLEDVAADEKGDFEGFGVRPKTN
jgi:hypothetical protein